MLNRKMKAQSDNKQDAIQYEIGSITGMLDWVNLHNDRNVFYVYPVYNNERIRCVFSKEKRDKVLAAIRKYVEVSGKLKYKNNSFELYEVEVDDIEVFPPADSLPTLESLRGIAAGALGDKSSEEYIQDIRNEWE